LYLVSLTCFGIVLLFPYFFGGVFLLQCSTFCLIFVLQDNQTSLQKKKYREEDYSRVPCFLQSVPLGRSVWSSEDIAGLKSCRANYLEGVS
jgi:hypothetical protein